jgi:cob(I)alamin adenosyltransferase
MSALTDYQEAAAALAALRADLATLRAAYTPDYDAIDALQRRIDAMLLDVEALWRIADAAVNTRTEKNIDQLEVIRTDAEEEVPPHETFIERLTSAIAQQTERLLP